MCWVGLVIWVLGSVQVEASEFRLEDILEANRLWMGGSVMDEVASLEHRFTVTEGDATYRGRYRAVAEGKMCVEIFVGEAMVYAEGWNGSRGWQWSPDRKGPEAVSQDAEAALRHGLELPGHFLSLSHVREQGHTVTLDGRELQNHVYHPLIKVVLTDGHTIWYLVHHETGAILKSRTFRALHPDIDSTKAWLETRYSNYQRVDGIMRAFRSEKWDMVRRKLVQTTQLETVRVNQAVPTAIFSGTTWLAMTRQKRNG